MGLLVEDCREFGVVRESGMLAETGLDLRGREESGSETIAALGQGRDWVY